MEKSAAGLLFLPGEIIIDILSRLPVDTVIQCKRVCKTWRSIVDHDPTFLALHTHRFMIKSVAAPCCCFFLYVNQFDSFSRLCTYRLHFGENHENDEDEDADNANNNKKNIFLSTHVKLSNKPTLEKHYPFHKTNSKKLIISCNGLILIASSSSSTDCNNMMVFNPVTKEYVDLPPSEEKKEEFHDGIIPLINHSTSTGFGYHPITKEYKIVRIKYPKNYTQVKDHGYIYVYIYTLGRSSWSRRREIKVENNSNNNRFASWYRFGDKGVVLNGVLHWIGSDGVLSFDLADEEFKTLPTPPLELDTSYYRESLGVLGGCLCVIRYINLYTKDIWVLSKHKEAGEDSCSWTKKFSICKGDCVFVSALGSGKVLFLRFYDQHGLHFVSYDPETGNYVQDEEKSFLDPLNRWSDIIPYVKSFVSLKALGEEHAKYICC